MKNWTRSFELSVSSGVKLNFPERKIFRRLLEPLNYAVHSTDRSPELRRLHSKLSSLLLKFAKIREAQEVHMDRQVKAEKKGTVETANAFKIEAKVRASVEREKGRHGNTIGIRSGLAAVSGSSSG